MYSLRYLRLVAFLAVLLALPLGLPTGISQGNSFATAELIQKGIHHYVMPAGSDTSTYQYFKISLAPGERIYVTIKCPAGADYDLYLYRPDQSQLDSSISTSEFDWVRATPSEVLGGIYYIAVRYWSGPTGTYELVVGPTRISSGTQTLTIPEDGRIFFEVNAQNGWAIEVTMTQPTDTDIDIYVYGPDGAFVGSSRKLAGQVEQISTTLEDSGFYLLEIEHYSGPGGSFQLSVTVGPKITLRILGLPSSLQTTVSVGGATVQDVAGGSTADVILADGGPATVSVTEYVTQTNQIRYHCSAATWSPSTSSHDFTYTAQYWLETNNGGHGTVSPASGWYDSGSSVQISIDESVGFIPVRYVFDRWDGSGVSSPTSHSTTVDMSAPRTVTAVWKEDYLYTIAAAGGGIVIIAAVAFFLLRRKPSAPSQPSYVPPPPPT